MAQQIYLRNTGRFAVVDNNVYPAVCRFKWFENADGYAARHQWVPTARANRVVWLHHLVLDTSDGMLVDHVNGDRLDNRRQNLRLGSRAQNARNKAKPSNNTTGFKGVHLDKRRKRNRWHAQINCDGKAYHLGNYPTAEEAARAYDGAALALHGEFARLNFTPETALPYPPQAPPKSARFKGVTKRKGGKWAARIGHEGRVLYVGLFDTEEEAARAYEAARARLHPHAHPHSSSAPQTQITSPSTVASPSG